MTSFAKVCSEMQALRNDVQSLTAVVQATKSADQLPTGRVLVFLGFITRVTSAFRSAASYDELCGTDTTKFLTRLDQAICGCWLLRSVNDTSEFCQH